MKTSKRFMALAALVLMIVTLSCEIGGQVSTPAETSSMARLTPTTQSEVLAPTAAILPTQPVQEPSLPATQADTATLPAAPSQPTATTAPPTSPPPQPSPTPCSGPVCTFSGSFLLKRPVGSGGRDTIDVSYRFGTYQRGQRDPHSGVDFLNSSGTPVLAVANGTVVVAGDDSQTAYARTPNVYGNLVILKHELPGISQPIFTLYAHLSQVSVKVNDAVKEGQEIGKVGMSGGVKGSTLHFEVRYGENTLAAARNPELWLAPRNDENGQPLGALAGRVLDAQGNGIAIRNVVIERLGGPGQPALDTFYLRTYADRRTTGLPPWEENFGISDLPPGSYQISFLHGIMQQQVVKVEPGRLTVITFHLK